MAQKDLTDVIKQTSQETTKSLQDCNLVVRQYWDEIHDSLVNYDNVRLSLKGLGYFAIKGSLFTIREAILENISYIRFIRNGGKSKKDKWRSWIDTNELLTKRLRSLLRLRNEQVHFWKRKAENRKNKKDFKSNNRRLLQLDEVEIGTHQSTDDQTSKLQVEGDQQSV